MVILSVDGKRGMESNEGYNYSEGEGSSSSGGGGGKGRRKGRKSSKVRARVCHCGICIIVILFVANMIDDLRVCEREVVVVGAWRLFSLWLRVRKVVKFNRTTHTHFQLLLPFFLFGGSHCTASYPIPP